MKGPMCQVGVQGPRWPHAEPPRVLVLSAYPVRVPLHGGQIRVQEVIDGYRALGLHVRHASVFPDHAEYLRTGLDAGDVPWPAATLRRWADREAPYLEDLALGEALARSAEALARIERHAAGPVAVLHLEQPWLLPAVKALRERGCLGDFALCYGSQNIEYPLRADMWRRAGVADVPDLQARVCTLEKAAVADADLVAAVTVRDAAQLKDWAGPSGPPVVLAANGVRPWRCSEPRLAHWRGVLARAGVAPRFVLFAGSDHPPNVSGFGECWGPSLASLPPGRHVVVAGRAGPAITSSVWYLAHAGINDSRMAVLGTVSAEDLAALRCLAHAFALPLTSGGGSSLKTAEAMHAGCHVVATPTAMRGFESLLPWDGLVVAEPGEAFAAAVRKVLAAPPRAPATHDPRRDELTWARTLRPLAAAVATLALARWGSPVTVPDALCAEDAPTRAWQVRAEGGAAAPQRETQDG